MWCVHYNAVVFIKKGRAASFHACKEGPEGGTRWKLAELWNILFIPPFKMDNHYLTPSLMGTVWAEAVCVELWSNDFIVGKCNCWQFVLKRLLSQGLPQRTCSIQNQVQVFLLRLLIWARRAWQHENCLRTRYPTPATLNYFGGLLFPLEFLFSHWSTSFYFMAQWLCSHDALHCLYAANSVTLWAE